MTWFHFRDCPGKEWHHPILFLLMVTCECLAAPTLNIIGLHSLNREIALFLLTSCQNVSLRQGQTGFPWPGGVPVAGAFCKTKRCSIGSQSCWALLNDGTGFDLMRIKVVSASDGTTQRDQVSHPIGIYYFLWMQTHQASSGVQSKEIHLQKIASSASQTKPSKPCKLTGFEDVLSKGTCLMSTHMYTNMCDFPFLDFSLRILLKSHVKVF